ncbi:unnamed protein product [Camellia sinensis]
MKRSGGNSDKLGGNGEEERAGQVDSGQNMKQGFGRRLVKYQSLPEYLKGNEFILDYYRCKWPLKETLFSALGGAYYICCVDRVELVGEDQYRKHDHEFLQTYASNTMDNDDDGDDNEDRCQRLRFFFPDGLNKYHVWSGYVCLKIGMTKFFSDPEDKKLEGYDDISKEIPDLDAKKLWILLTWNGAKVVSFNEAEDIKDHNSQMVSSLEQPLHHTKYEQFLKMVRVSATGMLSLAFKTRNATSLVAPAIAVGLGAFTHILGTLVPVIGASGFAAAAAATALGTIVSSFR